MGKKKSIVYIPAFIKDIEKDTLYFIQSNATRINKEKTILYINPFDYAVREETELHNICIVRKRNGIALHLDNIIDATVVSSEPIEPEPWISISITTLPIDILDEIAEQDKDLESEDIEDIWSDKSLDECCEEIYTYIDFLAKNKKTSMFSDPQLKAYQDAITNIINEIDTNMSSNAARTELLHLREELWDYDEDAYADEGDNEGETWKNDVEKTEDPKSEEEKLWEQEKKYFQSIITAIDKKILHLNADTFTAASETVSELLPIKSISVDIFKQTIEKYSKSELNTFIVSIDMDNGSNEEYEKGTIARDYLRSLNEKK
jgi:soluble cytochrome b562